MLQLNYHRSIGNIMDISSVGYGSALTPEVQAQYSAKCLKMSQQSQLIAGSLIQDTAEISAEALAKCTEEMNASIENLL